MHFSIWKKKKHTLPCILPLLEQLLLNYLLKCDAPYRGHPTNLFLKVSQWGYENFINGQASLQSRTGKWRNNELLKSFPFVFYG